MIDFSSSDVDSQLQITCSSFGLTETSVAMGGPTELGRFAPKATTRVFGSLEGDVCMSRSARLGESDWSGNIPWL